MCSSDCLALITSLPDIAINTDYCEHIYIYIYHRGFSRAGLLGSSIVLIFVAYLAYDTSIIMLKAQRGLFLRTNKVATFPEIAGSILGAPYNPIVKTATCISCFGGCCGYLIFLGSLCSQLLATSYQGGVFICTIPLVLVSWIRSFKELSWITILGCISLVLAAGIIIYDGYSQLKPNTSPPLFTNIELIKFNSLSAA